MIIADSEGRDGDEHFFNEMREAFGRDLADCYDSMLRQARRLLDGQTNPKALPTDRALEGWVATLDPAAREMTFALCQTMAIGALFNLMNVFDRTHAVFLPPGWRYKLIAEREGTGPDSVRLREVELNPVNQTWDLHDKLFDWMTRFSPFGAPPL